MRNLVLGMAKASANELLIDATASIPGGFTGPASRSYLYYTDELKHWISALQIRIDPRGE